MAQSFFMSANFLLTFTVYQPLVFLLAVLYRPVMKVKIMESIKDGNPVKMYFMYTYFSTRPVNVIHSLGARFQVAFPS